MSVSVARMWDGKRHIGKWPKNKVACVVVYVGTNHIYSYRREQGV